MKSRHVHFTYPPLPTLVYDYGHKVPGKKDGGFLVTHQSENFIVFQYSVNCLDGGFEN